MPMLDVAVSLGLFAMILGVYTYVYAAANTTRKELQEHREKVDVLTCAHKDKVDLAMTAIKSDVADFRVDITSRLVRIETKLEGGNSAIQRKRSAREIEG